MRRMNCVKIISFFCVLTILFKPSFANADTTDAHQIKEVFERYRYAILNDEGKLAFQCIDSRTKKYYGQLYQWILKDDSMALEKHSLVDKFTVLAIRAKASKQEILGMDSSTLFMYAINHGMVGKNGASNQKIAEPIADSTFGKAALMLDEKETSVFFHFYKEDGQWKMDISHLLPMANSSFRSMIEESDMTENEFIFDLLRILEGRTPNHTLWLPLVKE